MAKGGYDGSLRFNTKIDEDGFLRTVKDLERSLTALEQTVGKLTKVMQAGFSQASTGAEQAAADVAKLSDAADTAAENFSQLPDSVTVTVQAETDGITEAQTALDSIPDEQVTVSAMPEGVDSVQAELDSIPDEEVHIIPDVEWNAADFETVEIPAELDVDTADFSSAYDVAIEHIKSKFGTLRDSIRSIGKRVAQPSEQIGSDIGNGISRGIEKADPLNGLRSMLRRAAGLVASFFGIRAIASFGKESITLAFDMTELESKRDAANSEMLFLADIAENLIAENARIPQDQKEYNKKYKTAMERYETAKAAYDNIIAQIAEENKRIKQIESFINNVRELGPLTEFDEELWGVLVESVTVYSKDDIRVEFRN